MKILLEFYICLSYGYTLWEGQCTTSAIVKIPILDVIPKNKAHLMQREYS